jgi:hypothetical protein
MSIPEEYTGIRKVGFNPPHIAYFVSRLGVQGHLASCLFFLPMRLDLQLWVFAFHAPPSEVNPCYISVQLTD